MSVKRKHTEFLVGMFIIIPLKYKIHDDFTFSIQIKICSMQ